MVLNINTVRDKVIDNPKIVADIIISILKLENEVDKMKEHFWVIGLNSRLQVVYIELVSLGILGNTLVHPREIFRFAIMKAVSKIFLIHNHPSGDIRPSKDDFDITIKLEEASKILEIPILDHLIVNLNGDYFSFIGEGVL